LKCEDFFLGLLMSVLEPDEIVTAIRVPVTGIDKTAYMKAAPRSSGFAVTGVAVRLAIDAAGTCSRAAIGITGVTDKAYRPERLEQMLTGKKLDENLIAQAAGEATRNVEVIEDINGSADIASTYRSLRGASDPEALRLNRPRPKWSVQVAWPAVPFYDRQLALRG
jgi:carbon-monoxide dehydrogenase medium subunit